MKFKMAIGASMALLCGVSGIPQPVQAKSNAAKVAIGTGVGVGVTLGVLHALDHKRRDKVIIENNYYAPPAVIVPTEPRRAVEVCRSGVLRAARRYGALSANIIRIRNFRDLPGENSDIVATVSVSYPNFKRVSDVRCVVRNGYLVSADAI